MKALGLFYAGTITAFAALGANEWGFEDGFTVLALGAGLAMVVSLLHVGKSPPARGKTQ